MKILKLVIILSISLQVYSLNCQGGFKGFFRDVKNFFKGYEPLKNEPSLSRSFSGLENSGSLKSDKKTELNQPVKFEKTSNLKTSNLSNKKEHFYVDPKIFDEKKLNNNNSTVTEQPYEAVSEELLSKDPYNSNTSKSLREYNLNAPLPLTPFQSFTEANSLHRSSESTFLHNPNREGMPLPDIPLTPNTQRRMDDIKRKKLEDDESEINRKMTFLERQKKILNAQLKALNSKQLN